MKGVSLESPYKVGSPISLKELSTLDSTRNFLTPNKSSPSRGVDRYIPSSIKSNLYDLYFNEKVCEWEEQGLETIHSDGNGREDCSLVFSENKNYSNLLKANIVNALPLHSSLDANENAIHGKKENLLSFSTPKKTNKENEISDFSISGKKVQNSPKKEREIKEEPYKVLDAPGLAKDFYLNLLDWSKTDMIAIGLENTAYAWSSSKLVSVYEVDDPDYISAISWGESNNHLTVGTSSGEVKLFDVAREKLIHTFPNHYGRVTNLKWNGNTLASAGSDALIKLSDYRVKRAIQEFQGHEKEICGLQWSPNGSQIATGANDNKVKVWSLRSGRELADFSNHTAAVKALAWSPYNSGELVSGGGTADKFIRFWNTNTLSQIKAINTQSQVCNIQYSKFENEIVSTHGYNSNQVIVWDSRTMKKIVSLNGHSDRIFYCAFSPCGRDIVTGAGDETLRFWRLYEDNYKKKGTISKCSPSSFDLR